MLALAASFSAGVLVDGWLRTYGPPKPVHAAGATDDNAEPTVAAAPRVGADPAASTARPGIAAATVTPADVPKATGLRLPIDGISAEALKGGFAELRGSRPHEAADILAPRGTLIHAVKDGTIAKLFFSKQGGNTIYQFDADGRLCFYYAHLGRYADGLHEGQLVSRGEVLGYVGTSGNAPPGTPHLHFAIFELNADRRWWQGRALDPYLVYKEQG